MAGLEIFNGNPHQVLSGHPVVAPISRHPDHARPHADAAVREDGTPHLSEQPWEQIDGVAVTAEPVTHGRGHERRVRQGIDQIVDVQIQYI